MPRKIIRILCTGSLICIILFSTEDLNAQNALHVEGGVGVDWSGLNWAVAGNSDGNSPNVLSELKWRKLYGVRYDLGALWEKRKITFFINASIAPNLNGRVEDTDYGGNDRTNVIYDRSFSSSNSRKINLETGVGSFIRNSDKKKVLGFFVGARYNTQRMFLDQATAQSYYNSTWTGIFLGLNKELKINNILKLLFTGDVNYAAYRAYADWQLRNDFAHPKSFTQKATSLGYDVGFQSVFQLNQVIQFKAYFKGCINNSFKGTDLLYFKTGESVSTQLNGVNSSSLNAGAGLNYAF